MKITKRNCRKERPKKNKIAIQWKPLNTTTVEQTES